MSSLINEKRSAASKSLAPLLLIGLALGCGAREGKAEQPAQAASPYASAPEEHPVTATLITEHASIHPGIQTRVGVHFDLEPGWHIYGADPGDAGLPTTIVWTVPPGFKIGPITWPPSETFTDAGNIRTFGYSGVLVLASALKHVASRESLTEAPIHAHVEWLACKQICLPGSADLDLAIPIREGPALPSTHAELFAQVTE